MIRTVLNQIKLDSRYYYDFIEVLEKNKEYYSSILQIIREYSHDVSLQRRPLSSESQHHSDDEESRSEDESSDKSSPKPELG